MDKYLFPLQLVILNLFLILASVNGSKLNVPRVKLPVFNDISTKFILETSDEGCFKWSTTRSDIIQLTPITEHGETECFSKVAVTTVTKELARNIAVVLAEDTNTEQTLRCDVIVDVISKLEIHTTTKELFMEEAPETFELKAFDEEGNEFSTLEGVKIDWNIITLGPKKDAVLRYIKYKDSPYDTPPSIEELENDNLKGYKILLEGVKSGTAQVIAKLPYSEYDNVKPCEVTLMVVENLLITPTEAYMMPGDVITFRVFSLNNGRMDELSIPDAHYFMDTEDSSIADTVKSTTKITGLKEGRTRVVLRDKNAGASDPVLKLPAATLYVVNPDYLMINVLPHKNPAILVGDSHDLSIEVYSRNHHKLVPGEMVEIITEIAPEFFVVQKTKNGTWINGHGMKPSVVTVQARLEKIDNPSLGKFKFDRPIVATLDLVIYPRITITPAEVILPWDPTTRPKYDIDLIVKGGDGRFIWTSSDHKVGVVSQSGHVRTYSNGFFEVSAAMLRNHHNRETAKVVILPPAKLEIVEFIMEAEVGKPVFLHIALYAERIDDEGNAMQIPYTQCQELPFQIKQSDPKFKQNKTGSIPPVGVSCGNIAMVALTVGSSKVTVTYFQDGRALEDSVTVSAYNPLTLLQPKDAVVLAVGTSVNLIYTGGPRPAIGRPGDHERIVVSENEQIASVYDLTDPNVTEDMTVIRVLCHTLGETDIRLIVSNKPVSANGKCQSASITTRITCGKPRKIILQPNFDVSDECPMDLSSGNVVIPNFKNVDINVDVFDDCGHRLLNITSYLFLWTIYPSAAGKFLNKDATFPRDIVVGSVRVADRAFQTLVTSEFKQLTINVTLTGYNKKLLKKYNIIPESPPFKEKTDKDVPVVATSLSLYLVDEASLEETSISIYNDPSNAKRIGVKQGSGFFEIALSNDDIATVTYFESSKEIEIRPKKSGELTVQLKDLCLPGVPVSLHVNIVAVGLIRVEMIDKVEIGKCIRSIVRLYDENDNLMELPDRRLITIKPILESKIANIEQDAEDPNNPWGTGEIHYIVSGIEAGDTKLLFIVGGGEENVESAPVDLQVFYPLRIHPRNGTILIKSHIQYIAKGGPQPDSTIEYILLPVTKGSPIVTINPKGVVFGLAKGSVKVTARAIGMHPSTGQKIIYSEDTVDMTVIPLQDIKIKMPSVRVHVGSLLPVWAWGSPGDISPMILGTIENPPLIFKWELKDNRIADFNTMTQMFGIESNNVDKVVNRLYGLAPGKTSLMLNVTVSGIVTDNPKLETVKLSSSIEIEVILPFKFTRPKYLMGEELMMAPHSEIPLQTNFDGTNTKIHYALPGNDVPSTEVLANPQSPKDKVVTVSQKGLLKSYGTLGHAMLIVTDTDSHGLKQTISVVIEVKPIHYMTLKVRTNWKIHSNTPLSYVPLGTVFSLKAMFHDVIGNKFVAGPLEIKIRLSRCDLIEISEGPEVSSVQIATIKPGVTMIKVWAEGIQNTATYVKIRVEQSVQPVLDDLTAGDIVCLYAPVISEFNTPGMWRTSDPEIVQIQSDLDIGFVQNKQGVVVLTHSLLPAAPLQIEVLPVSEIEFLYLKKHSLTNGEWDSLMRVPIVLHSEKSVGMKTNNLISGWRCRADVRNLVRPDFFICSAEFDNSTDVTFSSVFNITNSIVPETGSYACKFVSMGIYNKEVAVLDTDVILTVSTRDESVTRTLRIEFAPRIFVPDEIVIGDDGGNTASFEVTGLPRILNQVSIEAADSSILYIDKGTKIDENTIKYEVQLIDYHWRLANLEDAMGIVVKSPITKQDQRIIVKVLGSVSTPTCAVGRSPIFNFLYLYRNALIMALAMLVVFFLTFYFYSHFMQPVVNVNVNAPPKDGLYPGMASSRVAQLYRHNTSGPAFNTSTSPIQTSPIKTQCNTCKRARCGCQASRTKEPIYGDVSSFYTSSPENRRFPKDM